MVLSPQTRNELPSFRGHVPVCPLSQSSLQLDLDSCLTRLHYIALLDAAHLLRYYICTRCGVRSVRSQNLPGLVPRNPGSPLTQKLSHPSLPCDKSEGGLSTPPWVGCRWSRASLGRPQPNPQKTSPHVICRGNT